jgi:hypothetical protein
MRVTVFSSGLRLIKMHVHVSFIHTVFNVNATVKSEDRHSLLSAVCCLRVVGRGSDLGGTSLDGIYLNSNSLVRCVVVRSTVSDHTFFFRF